MSLNFGQNLFPPRREFIASFDFIDVVQNQGYGSFFLMKGNDNAAATKSLIVSTVTDSEPTTTAATLTDNSGVFTKLSDTDFDITVNRTLTIKGKAFMEVTWKTIAVGGSFNGNAYIIATLVHYDGSTETDLGEGRTGTLAISDASTRFSRDVLTMDVTSQIFKKGDIIRVTVEVWGEVSTAGTGTITYYHDPASRETVDTNKTTDFKALIPFDLQI